MVAIENVTIISRLKRFKPVAAATPPKTTELQQTLTGVTPALPLYLKVTGTGVTAGKSVRPCLELAGITDILSKAYGSTSPKNLVKATIAALRALQSKEQVERIRGTALGARAGELD